MEEKLRAYLGGTGEGDTRSGEPVGEEEEGGGYASEKASIGFEEKGGGRLSSSGLMLERKEESSIARSFYGGRGRGRRGRAKLAPMAVRQGEKDWRGIDFVADTMVRGRYAAGR